MGVHDQLHVKWMIGDGMTIKIYEDSWITLISLRLWPTYINIDQISLDMHVRYFITPMSMWDISKLNIYFAPQLVDNIYLIPLPPKNWEDRLVWEKINQKKVSLVDIKLLHSLPLLRDQNSNSFYGYEN